MVICTVIVFMYSTHITIEIVHVSFILLALKLDLLIEHVT